MNLPLNIDWQQILLHLFNFVLLFAILYFLLYKPVKDFMEKRTRYYKDMDDEAKKAVEEAKAQEETYRKKVEAVDEEIASKKQAAMEQAALERKEIIEQARNEGDGIIEQAKKKAKVEHERMISSAEAEITDMVALATEKIVHSGNVSDSYDDFLNSVDSKNGADDE